MPRRTVLTEKNRAKRAVNRAAELGRGKGRKPNTKTGGAATPSSRRRGATTKAQTASPGRANVRPGRKVSERAPVPRTKTPSAPKSVARRAGGTKAGQRTGQRQLKGATRVAGRKRAR